METAIDRMRERVRDIYRAITGNELSERSDGQPLPGGWDALQYVRARWLELERMAAYLRVPVAPLWSPRLDVIEREHEIELQFELPGVAREEVDVSVENGHLVVEGRRGPIATSGDGVGYRWREIPTGMFRRAVTLPPGLRVDELKATAADGLLRVHLPTLNAPARRDKTEVH